MKALNCPLPSSSPLLVGEQWIGDVTRLLCGEDIQSLYTKFLQACITTFALQHPNRSTIRACPIELLSNRRVFLYSLKSKLLAKGAWDPQLEEPASAFYDMACDHFTLHISQANDCDPLKSFPEDTNSAVIAASSFPSSFTAAYCLLFAPHIQNVYQSRYATRARALYNRALHLFSLLNLNQLRQIRKSSLINSFFPPFFTVPIKEFLSTMKQELGVDYLPAFDGPLSQFFISARDAAIEDWCDVQGSLEEKLLATEGELLELSPVFEGHHTSLLFSFFRTFLAKWRWVVRISSQMVIGYAHLLEHTKEDDDAITSPEKISIEGEGESESSGDVGIETQPAKLNDDADVHIKASSKKLQLNTNSNSIESSSISNLYSMLFDGLPTSENHHLHSSLSSTHPDVHILDDESYLSCISRFGNNLKHFADETRSSAKMDNPKTSASKIPQESDEDGMFSLFIVGTSISAVIARIQSYLALTLPTAWIADAFQVFYQIFGIDGLVPATCTS